MAATLDHARIRVGRAGWALYVVLGLLLGVYLGINQIIDLGGKVEDWKPMVWEISSVIVIFTLIPFVVRFERRFRLNAHPRWRIIAAHLGAALAFSALHIAGMLNSRKTSSLISAYWSSSLRSASFKSGAAPICGLRNSPPISAKRA
jgi:hypothetical protein